MQLSIHLFIYLAVLSLICWSLAPFILHLSLISYLSIGQSVLSLYPAWFGFVIAAQSSVFIQKDFMGRFLEPSAMLINHMRALMMRNRILAWHLAHLTVQAAASLLFCFFSPPRINKKWLIPAGCQWGSSERISKQNCCGWSFHLHGSMQKYRPCLTLISNPGLSHHPAATSISPIPNCDPGT